MEISRKNWFWILRTWTCESLEWIRGYQGHLTRWHPIYHPRKETAGYRQSPKAHMLARADDHRCSVSFNVRTVGIPNGQFPHLFVTNITTSRITWKLTLFDWRDFVIFHHSAWIKIALFLESSKRERERICINSQIFNVEQDT